VVFDRAAKEEQRDSDGQVVDRSFLAKVRWREIHCDAPKRILESRRENRRPHALGRLAHGGVRQADDRARWERGVREASFDFAGDGLDPGEHVGCYATDHACETNSEFRESRRLRPAVGSAPLLPAQEICGIHYAASMDSPSSESAADARPTLAAFDGLASTYERHRPRYPRAVFDAILDGLPTPATVADIGCGTGISARALAVCGARVIGIDPGLDMLREARAAPATFPQLEFRQGTAEATGLADVSVDAVLAAQAFHWFDAARALAEFRRILRPGGRAAILWNLRISDGGFTDEYNRIVVSASERLDPSARFGREALDAPLCASPLFHNVRVIVAPSPQSLDELGAIGRATSASYFPRSEPERSQRISELVGAVRKYAIDGRVTLAQEARLTVATRS